jgi:hypothetical protein
MNNETFNLNSLSKEELSTILESLLFSSSVDICANWYKENSINMMEVAKKIRKMYPQILIENVYVYESKDVEHNDEHTDEIVNMFPEIRKEKLELI